MSRKIKSACVCGAPAEFILYRSKIDHQAEQVGMGGIPRVGRCGDCLPPNIERVSPFAFAVKRPDVPWTKPYGDRVVTVR